MTQIFEGLKVLDFTEGMLGSVATMVLSDYGAEVIKVEPPGGLRSRSIPASVQWNRGKKSIVLDLNEPEGRDYAQRLSLQSDVVIESFCPGTTQSMGIDYETLSAERPDLVYCSLTGWGPKGPYAHYKPYEGAVAAKVGRMMVFSGQANRPGPHYAAVQTATHAANMGAVRGIIAALHVRDKTGHGQKVETSLMQAMNLYEFIDLVFWQMMVRFPDEFSEHPWLRGYPTLAYLPVRTKDGHWIQMANTVQRLFVAMIHDIGLGHIFEESRFEKAPVLMPEDREELRMIMLARFQEKTLEEWMDLFINKTRDVAAEPYRTSEEGMTHSQILHNGHVRDVLDPVVGMTRQLGPISLMSETPGEIQGPAPLPRPAHPGGPGLAWQLKRQDERLRLCPPAKASPGGRYGAGPCHGHCRPPWVRSPGGDGGKGHPDRDAPGRPAARNVQGGHRQQDYGRLRGHVPGPEDSGGTEDCA